MKKRIISMCLALALVIAMFPQIGIRSNAAQSAEISYEMREEVIEFKLSDGTLYYTNTISYPYFLGNTAAEIKINNKYSAIIEECRSNTTDFDALYQEVLQWSPDGVNGLPFYDDITAEVTYCNNGVISIKECSTMWSGGVHPYSDYVGYTYRISDGSELSLTDILSGSDDEIKSLIERYNQGAASYYKAEVVMASPFMLTSAGLCFLCNVGDAVPRAEIVIPFTEADAFSIFEESKSESSTTTGGTGYIGAVQKAIDEMQAVGWGSGYGALYDVDGNGIEELIMVYSVSMETDDGYGFPAKACSLYTMANGKAIQLIDKEVLYVEAGGPSGYAAVVEHDGNIYFAITSETGETGGGPGYSINRYGTWKLYSINGESIDVNTTVEYDYFRGADIEYEKSSALFNGKSRSYREYEEWRDSLVEVLVVDGYYYDEKPESVMTLDELLAYLKENPVEDTSVSVDDSTFEESENRNGLVIYSDYTNRQVSKGSVITLGAVVLSNGVAVDDASDITFQIADPSIISVVSTDYKNNFRYVKLKGLEAGTTNVAFCDSATGNTIIVPITVYENRYHSYTLSNVPTQQIEKYPTNFYNVNGLYIDSYKYTVNGDQSATVSFDVYNTNYSYGSVEVFDENGDLKDVVLIDKMTSSNTGFKEAVLDNLAYLVRDVFQGDLLSYRQESGFSKLTRVSVKIPKNGYIKIYTDPENSSIVGLVNYADLLLSVLDFTDEITGFSTKSEEFADKLTAKVLNEKIFAEFVSDSNKMTQTLWKNVGKEALITTEAMGSFVDTAIKNLSDFGLLDVVLSTASDCGWSIGEKVFTDLSGPFGVALKVMFTMGKAENIIIQYHDVTHSAGLGSIVIQNQGGGIRSCQQVKVESEAGLADDTALNVFNVTLEADILDIIEKYNPDIYEQIVEGVTYTYNISFMKDGSETQPNGEVTVYIPIPDELKALAYAGDWIDGVPAKVKIYRIEEDGTLTEMDVRIEDGCFVFTTNHFSLYTIVGYDSGDDATPNRDENGLSIITIIGIAAVVIVGMGAIAIIKRKKK